MTIFVLRKDNIATFCVDDMESNNDNLNIKEEKTRNRIRRNPYADMGLVIAISVLIIMLVKSLLFGFSWGAIIWLIIVVIYLVLSVKFHSRSKVVKIATTVFLLLSIISVCLVTLFDKNTRPKMPAFQKAEEDTVKIEEPVVVEPEPIIPIVDTVVVDTSLTTEISDSSVAEHSHHSHEAGTGELHKEISDSVVRQ